MRFYNERILNFYFISGANNISIVIRSRKHSPKKELNLEQERTRWKLFYLAIGKIRTNLNSRGGETIVEKLAGDYTDVTHKNCILPSGV